ncbi:hypothetical protein [Noviherbaspirillum massiliense]|uniref:hypothetical protein n=1 Tax=Noviherbaspirillum massiliense TaxID=1465823 RepID=UPI0011DCC74D|nr:hypothetical protein [Noviherbaspirillum massiliense]
MKKLTKRITWAIAAGLCTSTDALGVTLCASNEEIVLSCRIEKSDKILSICSSKPLAATTGYMQYRYGRLGAIEMTYPASKIGTQRAFRLKANSHAEVFDTWLTFKAGKFVYSVYSIEDHGTDDKRPAYRHGVNVTSEGIVSSKKCSEPAQGRLDGLGTVVLEGDFGE